MFYCFVNSPLLYSAPGSKCQVMKPIYFDAFASIPMLPAVRDAMQASLNSHLGNPHSEHVIGMEAARSVESAKDALAVLYGGNPSDYVLTSGATEANNFALREGWRRESRDQIIISAVEHKCVMESARRSGANGAKVDVCPVKIDGTVSVDNLSYMLSERTSLVSVMAANNEIGSLNTVGRLCASAHNIGAYFHTDAAQMTTHGDFNVDDTDVDFASFSSHKIGGPIGIGALYISPKVGALRSLIEGGSQQGGMRAGTLSPLLCSGYAVALAEWTVNGSAMRIAIDQSIGRISTILGEFTKPKNMFGPPLGKRHRANLAIRLQAEADIAFANLFGRVCVSNGAACSAGTIERSHVLNAIGAKSNEHLMRISVSPNLQDTDVRKGASALLEALTEAYPQ